MPVVPKYDKDRIERLFLMGWTTEEIAISEGCSAAYARVILKRNGVSRRGFQIATILWWDQ